MPGHARENDSAANRNTNATTLWIIIDSSSYVEINILLPRAIISLLHVKTKALGATSPMSV
jgi:hypothetical protein